MVDARQRLEALAEVKARPDFVPLAVAFKRVANIQEKAGGAGAERVDPALLREDAERRLARRAGAGRGRRVVLREHRNYPAVLRNVATLEPAVARFFDDVLVMADEPALRANRLGLMRRVASLFAGRRGLPEDPGRAAAAAPGMMRRARAAPGGGALRRVAWFAVAFAAACGSAVNPDAGPLDRIYLPTGIAVHRTAAGARLLVASSNADLRYDVDTGGAVIALDPSADPAVLHGGVNLRSFVGDLVVARNEDSADPSFPEPDACGASALAAPLALTVTRGSNTLERDPHRPLGGARL